jgi:opacity protein-like surface antigen
MSRLKVIVSVLIVSVYSLSSFAQEKGPSFIGVAGGVSIPTGNWGKSRLVISTNGYANDPAGFANTGGLGGVEGAWFFSKHFGLGGLFTYSAYKTKDLSTLSLGYQQSFDVDSVHTTANSYKVWNIMPGIYFNYPIAKKLSLTARGLAGITNVTTPQIDVSINDGGIHDGDIHQEKATKTSYAFDLGAGLSYNVIKCLAINLRADYFYSKPDVSINNTARMNAAGRRVDQYNEAMMGVNVSLGVAYVFHSKK